MARDIEAFNGSTNLMDSNTILAEQLLALEVSHTKLAVDLHTPQGVVATVDQINTFRRLREKVLAISPNGHNDHTQVAVPSFNHHESRPLNVSTDTPQSQEQLVVAAKGGDAEAFGEIYQRNQPAIQAHLFGFMRNKQDAEDLSQDAFLKGFVAIPRTNANLIANLTSWFYRIGGNVGIDELRHRRLLNWIPWDEYVANFHPTQVAKNNVEKDVIEAEDNEEVQLILEKMTPIYRVVLVLRYYHDLSYYEMEEALGKTRGSVKSLLYRARVEYRGLHEKAERKPGRVTV